MALQLKQSLTLAQQLIMTPQLQQAIKLLQLSRLELLETVHTELQTNPVLEEHTSEGGDEEKELIKDSDSEPNFVEVDAREKMREDLDWESYLSEYNKGWAESPYEAREAPSFENVTASKPSLQSHLMWQLNMTRVSEPLKEIAIHIIGNLDDDGYLTVPVEELAQTTLRPLEDVLETLSIVQNFDPVGVAARDTRECLLIQARFQNFTGTLVEKIILDHMDKLENKKYDLIAKSLSVPLEEVLDSISTITTSSPSRAASTRMRRPSTSARTSTCSKWGKTTKSSSTKTGCPS
jgi:RNA polymerase sigma-54 factor